MFTWYRCLKTVYLPTRNDSLSLPHWCSIVKLEKANTRKRKFRWETTLERRRPTCRQLYYCCSRGSTEVSQYTNCTSTSRRSKDLGSIVWRTCAPRARARQGRQRQTGPCRQLPVLKWRQGIASRTGGNEWGDRRSAAGIRTDGGLHDDGTV